jgi:hypothetical protein
MKKRKTKNFIAKFFYWIGGQLCVVAMFFERLGAAIKAGLKSAAHTFKVYDTDGHCHHDNGGGGGGPYG